MNYIIATYSGILQSRPPDIDPENILQKHLSHLTYIFDLKKEKQLENKIKNVIIVCPTPKTTSYPNFYKSNKWLNIFKKKYPNINIYFIPYKGENKDHSYDQWIQGYLFKPYIEYNLLIEDDYVVDNLNFDLELISIYNQKFKDKIGYLCTWYDPHYSNFKHASITNGLISSLTFKKVNNNDLLKTFYETKDYNIPQLNFSKMLVDKNIPIDDLQGRFNLYFCHSTTQKITNYLEGKKQVENMFIPIQAFDRLSKLSLTREQLYKELCEVSGNLNDINHKWDKFYGSYHFPNFTYPGYRNTLLRLDEFGIEKNLKNYTFFDLACNLGHFSLELGRRGATVIGFEYCKERVHVCNKLAKFLNLENNVQFVSFDLNLEERFKKEFGKADRVICCAVDAYMDDKKSFYNFLSDITIETCYFETNCEEYKFQIPTFLKDKFKTITHRGISKSEGQSRQLYILDKKEPLYQSEINLFYREASKKTWKLEDKLIKEFRDGKFYERYKNLLLRLNQKKIKYIPEMGFNYPMRSIRRFFENAKTIEEIKNSLTQSEKEVIKEQLVECMRLINREGFAHRDMNSRNILWLPEQRLIKVIDWEFICEEENDISTCYDLTLLGENNQLPKECKNTIFFTCTNHSSINRIFDNGLTMYDFVKLNDSYSHYRQDVYIDLICYPKGNERHKGVFLEILISNGIEGSNTYHFDTFRNWHGLIVQPLSRFKKIIRKNRKGRCFDGYIHTKNGFFEFIEVEGSSCYPLSGVKEGIHPYFMSRIEYEIRMSNSGRKTLPVECKTISTLINEYELGDTIDLLSLYASSNEYNILTTLNLQKHHFKIITLNINNRIKINEILKWFEDNNYRLYRKIKDKDVYIFVNDDIRFSWET